MSITYTARPSEIAYNAFPGAPFDEWHVTRFNDETGDTQTYTARRQRNNKTWWIRNQISGHVIDLNSRIHKRVIRAVKEFEDRDEQRV